MNKIEELFSTINNGMFRGSQIKVAKALGITDANVNRYVKGLTKPSPDIIKKMSKLFKRPEEELKLIFNISNKERSFKPTPIVVAQRVNLVPMLGEVFADRFKCIVCDQEPELFLGVLKGGIMIMPSKLKAIVWSLRLKRASTLSSAPASLLGRGT
ncbi:transcriptional regulator with XRE-family HTH domain [Elusimicrobium simillimum]|uniref:helix-turn-helix domain-containing protein n=1 Tax=Elusimicrobium simillimum TaxID=3143438 RepID=UPI003C70114A